MALMMVSASLATAGLDVLPPQTCRSAKLNHSSPLPPPCPKSQPEH